MKAAIIPFCLLVSSSAIAGMASSGGGFSALTEYNPWFVGDEPARYCVETDPAGFSVDKERARELVRAALSDWTSNLRRMRPYESKDPGLDGKLKRLTLDFVEDCTGKPELTFLLGTSDARVQGKANRRTVGLALPLTDDRVTGRKSGVIWVAADRGPRQYQDVPVYLRPRVVDPDFWKLGDRLYNVLLHEVGHLFLGSRHIVHTLMGENQPADFVAGGRGVKLSSAFYFIPDWTDPESPPVCGALNRGFESGKLAGLNPTFAQATRFCLFAASRTADVQALRIELKTEAGAVLGNIELSDMRDNLGPQEPGEREHHLLIHIGGNYRFKAGSREDIREIDFVDYKMTHDLSGVIRSRGKALPATIRTQWPAVDNSIIHLEYFDAGRYVSGELVIEH